MIGLDGPGQRRHEYGVYTHVCTLIQYLFQSPNLSSPFFRDWHVSVLFFVPVEERQVQNALLPPFVIGTLCMSDEVDLLGRQESSQVLSQLLRTPTLVSEPLSNSGQKDHQLPIVSVVSLQEADNGV